MQTVLFNLLVRERKHFRATFCIQTRESLQGASESPSSEVTPTKMGTLWKFPLISASYWSSGKTGLALAESIAGVK